MKKGTSFRIEEEQITQLEKLVQYFQQTINDATNESITANISKASVLELLIKEKFNGLKREGKVE